MIVTMVRLTVKPGSGDCFERAFADQAEAVRANEPGNRLYELFRSKKPDGGYMLVEIYEDDDALARHRASPHMAVHRPRTTPFLAIAPDIEMFDHV
ncbi:putative quinol monooxygenase [Sphingomonas sp. XXL09]|uniref:putative quinol monooxygenase n=1 Tax=Sphingomonas sp. XXL09 TaxID=3457787 RepID=UPI00406BA552